MSERGFTLELAADLISDFELKLSPDELLHALGRAAAVHDEEIKFFHVLRAIPEQRACYERFAQHMHAALDEWREMDEDARHGLAWSAHASGHLQWLDWPETDYHVPVEEIAGQMASALSDLASTAQTAGDALATREEGNPSTSRSSEAKLPLHGLFAFAVELKSLWERDPDARFGQEFERSGDDLEPVAGASKFFCRCAERLSISYTTANCRTAMRRAQQGSGFGWDRPLKDS